MHEEKKNDGSTIFSVELLKRIPQKLYLNGEPYPASLPAALAACSGLAAAGWCGFALKSGWGSSAVLIGVIAAALTGYAVWLLLTWFLFPLMRARGFYPEIEYLPDEHKIVISDKPGMSLWGDANAVVTVFLDSIMGVILMREQDGWVIAIKLKKGDPLKIRSSTRATKSEASQIAINLAAMLTMPLEEKELTDSQGRLRV